MNSLHYRGNHEKFTPNRILGPDLAGAWYQPVGAVHMMGYTEIFYKPVPPDKLPPDAARISQMQAMQANTRAALKNWRAW